MARTLLHSWAERLNNRQDVSELYARNAVFLGTFTPELRMGRAQVRAYFHNLYQTPSFRTVQFRRSTTQYVAPGVAVISGYYDFHFQRKVVHARFSITCNRTRGGKWRIVNHHSSLKR